MNNERGSMVWNLPDTLQYIPEGRILVTVTITNPTEEMRLYFLVWALVRDGTILVVGGIEIEDIEDWVIEGGESKEISFELSPEFSDCYLNISLLGGLSVEEEKLEMEKDIIDSLTTYLYSTAVVPADWGDIGMIWALMPIMVIFMVLTMVSKISMKILEPEVLREVRPIAEEVALAKARPKMLTGG